MNKTTFSHKYKLNQKVWARLGGEPHEYEVIGIIYSEKLYNRKEGLIKCISYLLKELPRCYLTEEDEKNVYASKEELLKAIAKYMRNRI